MERAPEEDKSPVLKLAATRGRCYEFLSYTHVCTLYNIAQQ